MDRQYIKILGKRIECSPFRSRADETILLKDNGINKFDSHALPLIASVFSIISAIFERQIRGSTRAVNKYIPFFCSLLMQRISQQDLSFDNPKK